MDRERRDNEPTATDRGSAVAEFALVAPLLVGVLLAVLQLAFAVHVRDTLVAAAADGARVAATNGHTLADGVASTRSLTSAALSPRYAESVTAGYTTVGGVAAVVVTVRAPLPLLGLWGPGGDLQVQAHALVERP